MILTILKTIGIIILVILFLIILILAVALLTPVKYKFNAKYYDDPDILAVVKYAPVGLNAKVTFKEDTLKYTVKALGGVIMTNTDEKLSWLGKKISGAGDDGENGHNADNVTAENSEENNEEKLPSTYVESTNESDGNAVDLDSTNVDDKQDDITGDDDNGAPDGGKMKKKRVKRLKKPKDERPLSEKIAEKTERIKQKYTEIVSKLKKLNKKREGLLKVLQSDRFEVAKKDMIRYIKSLLNAIKPKKLNGNIHFGFDDPATTGQVLGGLATFLPLYDGKIDIRPDFEKQIIEGIVDGYGKFRLITFVKTGIKILFNRNLMRVIKRIQTILEA